MIPALELRQDVDPRNFALLLLQRLGNTGIDMLEKVVRGHGLHGIGGGAFVHAVLRCLAYSVNLPESATYPWQRKAVTAAAAGGATGSVKYYESADLIGGFLPDVVMTHGGLNLVDVARAYPFHSTGCREITKREESMAEYINKVRSLANVSGGGGDGAAGGAVEPRMLALSGIGKGSKGAACGPPTALGGVAIFTSAESLHYALAMLYHEIDEGQQDRLSWEDISAFFADVSSHGMLSYGSQRIGRFYCSFRRDTELAAPVGSRNLSLATPSTATRTSPLICAHSLHHRGRIVAATASSELFLIDSNTLETRERLNYSPAFGHVVQLASMRRLSNENFIAASSADCKLRVLSDDGRADVVYTRPFGSTQTALKYIPEMRSLLCGSRSGIMSRCSLEHGNEWVTAQFSSHHQSTVTDFCFLTKKHHLAASMLDGGVQVYDADAAAPLSFLRHKAAVHCLSYSEHFDLLAVGGAESSPKLYVPGDARCVIAALRDANETHRALVRWVHFQLGTPQFFSVDESGVVKTWDVRNFQCVQTIRHKLGVAPGADAPASPSLVHVDFFDAYRRLLLYDHRSVAKFSYSDVVHDEAASRDVFSLDVVGLESTSRTKQSHAGRGGSCEAGGHDDSDNEGGSEDDDVRTACAAIEAAMPRPTAALARASSFRRGPSGVPVAVPDALSDPVSSACLRQEVELDDRTKQRLANEAESIIVGCTSKFVYVWHGKSGEKLDCIAPMAEECMMHVADDDDDGREDRTIIAENGDDGRGSSTRRSSVKSTPSASLLSPKQPGLLGGAAAFGAGGGGGRARSCSLASDLTIGNATPSQRRKSSTAATRRRPTMTPSATTTPHAAALPLFSPSRKVSAVSSAVGARPAAELSLEQGVVAAANNRDSAAATDNNNDSGADALTTRYPPVMHQRAQLSSCTAYFRSKTTLMEEVSIARERLDGQRQQVAETERHAGLFGAALSQPPAASLHTATTLSALSPADSAMTPTTVSLPVDAIDAAQELYLDRLENLIDSSAVASSPASKIFVGLLHVHVGSTHGTWYELAFSVFVQGWPHHQHHRVRLALEREEDLWRMSATYALSPLEAGRLVASAASRDPRALVRISNLECRSTTCPSDEVTSGPVVAQHSQGTAHAEGNDVDSSPSADGANSSPTVTTAASSEDPNSPRLVANSVTLLCGPKAVLAYRSHALGSVFKQSLSDEPAHAGSVWVHIPKPQSLLNNDNWTMLRSVIKSGGGAFARRRSSVSVMLMRKKRLRENRVLTRFVYVHLALDGNRNQFLVVDRYNRAVLRNLVIHALPDNAPALLSVIPPRFGPCRNDPFVVTGDSIGGVHLHSLPQTLRHYPACVTRFTSFHPSDTEKFTPRCVSALISRRGLLYLASSNFVSVYDLCPLSKRLFPNNWQHVHHTPTEIESELNAPLVDDEPRALMGKLKQAPPTPQMVHRFQVDFCARVVAIAYHPFKECLVISGDSGVMGIFSMWGQLLAVVAPGGVEDDDSSEGTGAAGEAMPRSPGAKLSTSPHRRSTIGHENNAGSCGGDAGCLRLSSFRECTRGISALVERSTSGDLSFGGASTGSVIDEDVPEPWGPPPDEANILEIFRPMDSESDLESGSEQASLQASYTGFGLGGSATVSPMAASIRGRNGRAKPNLYGAALLQLQQQQQSGAFGAIHSAEAASCAGTPTHSRQQEQQQRRRSPEEALSLGRRKSSVARIQACLARRASSLRSGTPLVAVAGAVAVDNVEQVSEGGDETASQPTASELGSFRGAAMHVCRTNYWRSMSQLQTVGAVTVSGDGKDGGTGAGSPPAALPGRRRLGPFVATPAHRIFRDGSALRVRQDESFFEDVARMLDALVDEGIAIDELSGSGSPRAALPQAATTGEDEIAAGIARRRAELLTMISRLNNKAAAVEAAERAWSGAQRNAALRREERQRAALLLTAIECDERGDLVEPSARDKLALGGGSSEKQRRFETIGGGGAVPDKHRDRSDPEGLVTALTTTAATKKLISGSHTQILRLIEKYLQSDSASLRAATLRILGRERSAAGRGVLEADVLLHSDRGENPQIVRERFANSPVLTVEKLQAYGSSDDRSPVPLAHSPSTRQSSSPLAPSHGVLSGSVTMLQQSFALGGDGILMEGLLAGDNDRVLSPRDAAAEGLHARKRMTTRSWVSVIARPTASRSPQQRPRPNIAATLSLSPSARNSPDQSAATSAKAEHELQTVLLVAPGESDTTTPLETPHAASLSLSRPLSAQGARAQLKSIAVPPTACVAPTPQRGLVARQTIVEAPALLEPQSRPPVSIAAPATQSTAPATTCTTRTIQSHKITTSAMDAVCEQRRFEIGDRHLTPPIARRVFHQAKSERFWHGPSRWDQRREHLARDDEIAALCPGAMQRLWGTRPASASVEDRKNAFHCRTSAVRDPRAAPGSSQGSSGGNSIVPTALRGNEKLAERFSKEAHMVRRRR